MTNWSVAYGLDDLDEWLDEVPPPKPPPDSQRSGSWPEKEWFNGTYDCRNVAGWAGWSLIGTDAKGGLIYLRPESSTGDKSGTIRQGDDGEYIEIYTCGIDGLDNRTHDAWGFYVGLMYRGDWAAAEAAVQRPMLEDHVAADPAAVNGSHTGSDGQADPDDDGLIVVHGHTVKPVPIEWLWKGWLAHRKLVTCDGDPDTGKSTMLLDLTARITTGAKMPDGSPGDAPADVIVLAAEDDLDDTITPRLIAAGADLERVHHITGVRLGAAGDAPFTIPGDLAKLEKRIRRHGAVLVIVDVLAEYLDAKVDNHRDQDVRHALRQLRQVASRTGAAIVMLRHFTKASEGKAIHRGGGSVGIVGAARAGWMVAYHPDDEGLRVVAILKSNLAIKPSPLGFRLVAHDWLDCAYVSWQGPVSIGADQLVTPTAKEDPDKVSRLEYAMDVIRQILLPGTEVWSHELMALADEAQVKPRTLDEARSRLGVQVRRISKPETPDGPIGWKVWLPRGN
jgi:hypothetical protein